MDTTIKNKEGFRKVILYRTFSTKMGNMFLWFENNNQLAY